MHKRRERISFLANQWLAVFVFMFHLAACFAQDGGGHADLPNGDRQPIGFTGYVKDTESGLYYAGARYYDPVIGRFTSQDPVEGNPMRPPSLHRYLYAYANPTTYTDSTGRQVDIEDPSRAALALGWNDQQYAEAVGADTAAREVTAGAAYGSSKQVVEGAYVLGKWGARLLGKALFDIGDAKDVVDPVVRTVGETADAIDAGPVGLVDYEARKSVEFQALISQGRTIEAGAMYGPDVAVAAGGFAASARLAGLSVGFAGRGAAASVAVEGANGETLLRPMAGASTNESAFIGPTIGKSAFRTWDDFNSEAYHRYQRFVNNAYVDAIQAESEGLIRGNKNTRVGSFVDRQSREQFTDWLSSEGIPEGPDGPAKVNRWLRDSSGSGSYVRPDVQLPGIFMDATVGKKPPGTIQINRNAQYSDGIPTTVVRPAQLGGSCTVIDCPRR